jgi:hypothetical protein
MRDGGIHRAAADAWIRRIPERPSSEYTPRLYSRYRKPVNPGRLRPILLVFLLALALGWTVLSLRVGRDGDQFDFLLWEMQSLPNRWLYALGAPLRGPSPEDALARYFAAPDGSADARSFENVTEAAIEGRLTGALDAEGLGWPVPGMLPPVDFELAASPHVLVLSPRARIERVHSESLRPDLSLQDIEAIEREAEADGTYSALVVPTGGVATYPAIVGGDSYRDVVGAAAHEWVHHYMVLYPLGRAYFDSNDARTINETVADVVGDEIAERVIARYGVPSTSQPSGADPPVPSSVDPIMLLRDLRVEVDGLLAAGRIVEAEQRMQAAREELVRLNASIRPRRLNQAYFAWYGTYAARPDSVDPLGAQIRTVRERAGSLARFVEQVRDVRSRADVARLAGAASR